MFWKANVFKKSDVLGMSISRGYTDDMVMNMSLDVLSLITTGGYNFRGES